MEVIKGSRAALRLCRQPSDLGEEHQKRPAILASWCSSNHVRLLPTDRLVTVIRVTRSNRRVFPYLQGLGIQPRYKQGFCIIPRTLPPSSSERYPGSCSMCSQRSSRSSASTDVAGGWDGGFEDGVGVARVLMLGRARVSGRRMENVEVGLGSKPAKTKAWVRRSCAGPSGCPASLRRGGRRSGPRVPYPWPPGIPGEDAALDGRSVGIERLDKTRDLFFPIGAGEQRRTPTGIGEFTRPAATPRRGRAISLGQEDRLLLLGYSLEKPADDIGDVGQGLLPAKARRI